MPAIPAMARYSRIQAARKAAYARLDITEDWHQLTAAANSSPRHAGGLERWREAAREANPSLSDEQVEQQAKVLRSAYFSELGKRSGESRKSGHGSR